MSDTIQQGDRYRPVGKHWFALKLIAAFGMLALLSALPVDESVMHWGWVLIASYGILESAWMLLKPQRSRESIDDGQSLRTVRAQAALLLIAWAAIFIFTVQKLFVSE